MDKHKPDPFELTELALQLIVIVLVCAIGWVFFYSTAMIYQ